MKKMIYGMALACLSAGLMAGCGSKSYRDGTYTGQSEIYEVDETDEDMDEAANGYGVVELTISGGKITACTFTTYEEDGSCKDTEYGKEDGEVKNSDYYNKAQKAVAACEKYAAELVEKGTTKGIDAISGATINCDEFKDAVAAALDQAR